MIVLSLLAISVFAHSGSLDENGGHWDRTNGTYHFHDGTNTSASDSSDPDREYPNDDFEPPYEPPTDNSCKNNEDTKTYSAYDFLDIILAVLFCVLPMGIFIYMDFNQNHGCFTFAALAVLILYLMRYLIEEQTKIFWGIILIIVILVPIIIKLRKKYADAERVIMLYQDSFYRLHKYTNELYEIENKTKEHKPLCIPNCFEIGEDDLPKDKYSVLDWGKTFTLYQKNDRGKLHAKYRCCSATVPLHIYWYRNYNDFPNLLCGRCAGSYKIPDMSWYETYLRHKQEKIKRQQLKNSLKKLPQEIDVLHIKCNSVKIKLLIVFSRKNKSALKKANKKYAEIKRGQ